MLHQLPPVGDPIVLALDRTPEDALGRFFEPYDFSFYESGTAALAAAIHAAVRIKNVSNPEVLMPAYSCPDLISAALCAGTQPILVDLEDSRPWMDLDQLADKAGPRTVAILAIHLLGLPERLAEIRLMADDADALLIEDSAQSSPSPSHDRSTSDLIIFSFGRGKPISLLGGGVALFKNQEIGRVLHRPEPVRHRIKSLMYDIRTAAYNFFISPRLYGLAASLPLLQLGQTKFVPLKKISGIDEHSFQRLPANLQAYQHRGKGIQPLIGEIFERLPSNDILDLPRLCCGQIQPRLLRYPVLVLKSELRDSLYESLRHAGLGVSKMYPCTLPKISGLERILAPQMHFPCAEHLARTILTLPTHSGVSTKHIENMTSIFQTVLNVSLEETA